MKKISRFFDWLYIFLLKRIRPYDKQGMPLRQRRRRIRREVLSYYQNQTIDDPFFKEAISYLRHLMQCFSLHSFVINTNIVKFTSNLIRTAFPIG